MLAAKSAVLLCVLFVHVVFSQHSLPPRIIRGPIKEKDFRSDDSIKLECVAVGYPQPQYTWYKNGIPLEPKPNVEYQTDGILIRDLSVFDEGYYQCHAENQFGASVSNTTVLRRSMIGSYTSTAVTEFTNLDEGTPYVLRYSPIKCYPPPTFTWSTASSPTDQNPTGLITNKRMQIDDEGNLHFSYLLTGDDLAGKIYKCNVNNPVLDNTVGGSYTRLTITATGGPKNFKPVRSFASTSPVIAVVGRDTKLRCFFSAYPDATLAWSKPGSRMPVGRYGQLEFNTILSITNVQQSDEGEYLCRGANMVGSTDEFINIDVQSEPSFLRPEDQPSPTNATEGDAVTFNCNATAEPVANIAWYINGRPLDSANMPSRMRIVASGTRLTITNVCKTCSLEDDHRSTDLMVVQCNASNVHGYVFTDSYLNILDRTVITGKPQSVHLGHDGTAAEFHCAATSDPATPVELSWHRVYSDNSPASLVRNTSRVTIGDNGRLLTFSVAADNLEAWSQLRGQYECRATNGYSTDSAAFSLAVDDPPPPPLPIDEDFSHDMTTSSPGVGPLLAGASLADMWWIWLIIALVLLLIILIICCCLCCRRKGDTYFVDKKEKADHKNPEKELQDSQLQPYHRRDADPLKGSRASIGSSVRSGSDEDDDLNEYGDIDAGKFTEDGSFIGDYAPDQRQSGRKSDSYA